MSEPSGGQTRPPLVLGSGAVVVIAIIAIAFGVNSASAPLPAVPTATPAPPTPTPVPSPTLAAIIPFADCSTAKFGPVLAPLHLPASVHPYRAQPASPLHPRK